MALQLLGSSYFTPCKGLRIPLMFQLTKRNMSTTNYNVFKPAPNTGARGTTGNFQVQHAWASRARARAHLRRLSSECHPKRSDVRGAGLQALQFSLVGGAEADGEGVVGLP